MYYRLSRRRMIAGLVVCLLLACIGSLIIGNMAPRAFHSHRDTIADTLKRRDIEYIEIAFVQSIEDRNNLEFYHASVRVLLADGQIVTGWIGCTEGDSGCLLDLDPLDIKGVPLPELAPARPHPWLAAIEREVQEIYEFVIR